MVNSHIHLYICTLAALFIAAATNTKDVNGEERMGAIQSWMKLVNLSVCREWRQHSYMYM